MLNYGSIFFICLYFVNKFCTFTILGKAEQLRQQSILKLQELEQSNPEKKDPRQLLSELRKDTAALRQTANEKMQSDIHSRERTIRELERVMTSHPMTAEQVEGLQQELNSIQREIDEAQQRQDAASAGLDTKIGFFRDRVTAAEHKKEKLVEEVYTH